MTNPTYDAALADSERSGSASHFPLKLGNFLYLLGHELHADIKRVTEEDDHDFVFTFWWD